MNEAKLSLTTQERLKRKRRVEIRKNAVLFLVACAIIVVVVAIGGFLPTAVSAISRWLHISRSVQFVIAGCLIETWGAWSVRKRMSQPNFGIENLYRLHMALIDISFVVGGILFLVKAAYV